MAEATADLRVIATKLEEKYESYAHGNKSDPLDELVYIICSIKTGDQALQSSYSALRERFPSAEDLGEASVSDIEEVLKESGFANFKARTIKNALTAVRQQFAGWSLESLRSCPDEEIESRLSAIPGIGKKISRCVMLYAFQRAVFPVDSNCWRVANRLGWIAARRKDGTCSPAQMDELQELVPTDLRFSLHVNMFSLGKEVCTRRSPDCTACPLSRECPRIGVSS